MVAKHAVLLGTAQWLVPVDPTDQMLNSCMLRETSAPARCTKVCAALCHSAADFTIPLVLICASQASCPGLHKITKAVHRGDKAWLMKNQSKWEKHICGAQGHESRSGQNRLLRSATQHRCTVWRQLQYISHQAAASAHSKETMGSQHSRAGQGTLGMVGMTKESSQLHVRPLTRACSSICARQVSKSRSRAGRPALC